MDHGLKNLEILGDEPFRPFKRRKFYRKRANDDDAGQEELPSISNSKSRPYIPTEPLTQPSTPSDNEDHADGQSQLPIAEVLRHRRAAQRRRAGIEFTNATPVVEGSTPPTPRAGDEVLDNEDSLDKILTVVDRFAPQTGQVADVDKHMYAIPQLGLMFMVMQMLTV